MQAGQRHSLTLPTHVPLPASAAARAPPRHLCVAAQHPAASDGPPCSEDPPEAGGGGRIDWELISRRLLLVLRVAVVLGWMYFLMLTYQMIAWLPLQGKLVWGYLAMTLTLHMFDLI